MIILIAGSMYIGGILPLSLVDYPKKPCSVLFVSGCNFRCPYCFNRELILKRGNYASVEDIVEKLRKNKRFIDAVTITGGEPTLQGKELTHLCKLLKEHGFLVKLDTNGSMPEVIEKLIKQGLVDYIAMDIKTCFEKYKYVTKSNVDIKAIKKSMNILRKFGHYELRSTLVPGLHTKKHIESMAKEIKSCNVLYLQNFRPGNCLDVSYNKKKPFSPKDMEDFKNICSNYIKTIVRGEEITTIKTKK